MFCRFLEAYDSCATESEKEKLVASVKFGMHKKYVAYYFKNEI